MPLSQTKSGKAGSLSASLNRSNLMAGNLFSTRANSEAKILPLERIVPNPQQPRRSFDEEKLAELAEDVKAHGVLQPPIVRPLHDEAEGGPRYQLIVGERRYRAAILAGLKEIPVIVREYTDEEAGAISLVENLQREDLDIEDEALYFKKLADEYNLSSRQIGKLINKHHLYVYKRLKLLERPDLLAKVRQAELNLNTALEQIREEAAGADPESDPSDPPAENVESRRRSSRPAGAVAWKKFSQFTSYLKQELPKLEFNDSSEKAGLRETITELESHLAELKKRLEE